MADLRCFIAIEPPDNITRRVAMLAKELAGDGVVPVSRENIHITLKFLGDVGPDKLVKVEALLREIRLPKLRIKVRGVGVFPNENYVRVMWVGCEGADGLAKRIDEALAPLFKREPFTGHITLARVKKKINVRPFLQQYAKVNLGTFTADRFILKSSELTRSGPIYTTFAEFMLG